MDAPDDVERLLLRAAHVSAVANERLVMFCLAEFDFALRMLSIATLTGNDGVSMRARQSAKMTYYKAMCLVPTLSMDDQQRRSIDAKCHEVRARLEELGE